MQIKFNGQVPPRNPNTAIIIHNQPKNDWIDLCTADQWCNAAVAGNSTGADNGISDFTFNGIEGPFEIDLNIRNFRLEALNSSDF